MSRINVKLKALVDIKNGSTPSTKQQTFYNGDINWITPKDLSSKKQKYVLSGARNITIEGYQSCSTSLLPVGTVLMSSRAPIGLLAIAGKELCTNQGFKNLIPKNGIIDSEYLFYYLKTRVDDIADLGTGTTFKEVSKTEVENFEVNVEVDLITQKKTAKILSDLDLKIELNNEINGELESMAQLIYDYWFVQFDFPDENGKPYKSSGGKMVYNEELKREIPQDWSNGELQDIANITMGQSPSGDSYNEDRNGEVFYQGCTDFGLRFPTNRKFTTQPTRFAKTGDILLSVRAPVGTMNIANEDCCIGRGLAALNSKNGSITHLDGVLQHMKQIFDLRNSSGTTFGSITKGDLFSIPVVIPDKKTLQRFDEVTNPMFEKQNLIGSENQMLEELRDWLLPMLMNGQVTIKD